MALPIPKPLFTTLVISSLCIPFFTWITVYDKTFPCNILLPAFSIILDAILNILLIFFFPPNSVPQAPSLWAKTLVDVIINFGSAAIQTLSPRSLVYLLMSNFALIYLITILLVMKSTNFALLDLFISISPSFLQYFVEERMFWLLIPSSILLGVLICARNNNEIITNSMCIAKNSVNLLGIKGKNLFDSLRDSLVFIWKRAVKHEIGEEAAVADYVTIHVGGADERDGDDGAIQICGAPDGFAYELVGDFEEVAGEAGDVGEAIQIGGDSTGEFGNCEAGDDDGAIQTDEAPTGDVYERVGDVEDAGGVDDGFGNYEAGDDDEAIQIGGASTGEFGNCEAGDDDGAIQIDGAPDDDASELVGDFEEVAGEAGDVGEAIQIGGDSTGEFGNCEAGDDDGAIQTDEAPTGDVYERVGDAEDAGGVDDGFGNYEAGDDDEAIQISGASTGEFGNCEAGDDDGAIQIDGAPDDDASELVGDFEEVAGEAGDVGEAIQIGGDSTGEFGNCEAGDDDGAIQTDEAPTGDVYERVGDAEDAGGVDDGFGNYEAGDDDEAIQIGGASTGEFGNCEAGDDDGAIQIDGAPDDDASELVGDFEEVAGEAGDVGEAIQIGGDSTGEFGNCEAGDDDGAIQTDEAPTGDVYERVGDAEDAGGVDDGFGNYEADDDDGTIQIGAAPAGEFGNNEADDDDGAIQTDEAPTGDAYERVGDFEEVAGVDDGFGNYEAGDVGEAIQIGGDSTGEFGNCEAGDDDGAIQTDEAPTDDVYERVGDAEDAGGVDDGFGNYEADDDDGAIQIGAAPAGKFGNNEADDDDGAIQTDEAPTGDAYERVGDAEDAGGVDDGFGNYEADDDDGTIQIGAAPAGKFGNNEADDDDGAIQTDEAPTGDAYERVGDAEDAGGVDDGFGNYEAEYGNGAIHTGGAPAGTGVTIVYSAIEQDGDSDDAGGVDNVLDNDEADYGGAGIDKDL